MPLTMTPLPHQDRVADKLEEQPGQVAYHGLGSGKCALGDTLISTPTGPVRLDSFFTTELVGEEETLPVTGRLVDGVGHPVAVVSAYRQAFRGNMVRVETHRGNQITCTGVHRLLVHRGLSGPDWVEAQHLKEGELVCLHPVATAPKVDAVIDRDLLELLTWQICEGHDLPDKPAMSITNLDPAVLDCCQKAFQRLCPSSSSGHIRHYPPKAPRLDVCSAEYRALVVAAGYKWGGVSKDKELPVSWLAARDADVIRIIEILIDAEGSVTKQGIDFTVASVVLRDQLQYLLRRLGVMPAVHTRQAMATNGKRIKRDYARLLICGEDVCRLAEVGVRFTGKKQEAFERLVATAGKNPNCGLPLFDIEEALCAADLRGLFKQAGVTIQKAQTAGRAALASLRGICSSYLGAAALEAQRATLTNQWSHRTLRAAEANQPLLEQVVEQLTIRLTSPFRYERVKSATPVPGPRVVYDIEVDHPLHAYTLANGLITHNTMTAINAAHKHNVPLLAIVPAALRNNMRKEVENSGFKGEARVMSYQEALNKMHDPEFMDFASRSMMAIDEAHRSASEDSARRRIHGIPAYRKLMLSATPIRNTPSEVAPLINAVQPGTLPNDSTSFNRKYLDRIETPVGFLGALRGVKPGVSHQPKNLDDFARAVKGKVDFYESADRSAYPSTSESIVDVPMSNKQQAAYNLVMGRFPMVAYKIRHGLPPGKNEDADFKAFMSGPRQVANHPGSFHKGATDEDATKIQTAADEIDKRFKTDKNYRGVGYSAFLDSGVKPLSRALTARGIPHAMFTGEQDDVERKLMVEQYNAGKLPVLLISGAGAEGLDLKGTKHMTILEPHWNEGLINQVVGRGVRYKSHAHLPEAERHVEIQRFHSVPQPSWFDKLLGRTRAKEKGPDEYLYDRAKEKQQTIQPFLDIMKTAMIKVPAIAGTPAILLDLDGTLVDSTWDETTGECAQTLRPNVMTVLRQLKAKGYTLVGVTNRSCYAGTLHTLLNSLEVTSALTEHLLTDIIFSSVPDPSVLKPSPVMLNIALAKYGLDRSNTIMVGNTDDDANAAAAADVPYLPEDQLFTEAAQVRLPDAAELSATAVQATWHVDAHGRLIGRYPFTSELRGAIETKAGELNVAPYLVQDGDYLSIILPTDIGNDAALAMWIDSGCLVPPVSITRITDVTA
jgi:phosphoglycolate phosphatase-like HAD superfamily hydrolase